MRRVLREYYELATNSSVLKTKNGKGFKLVYVDPNVSTDNTFDNKELVNYPQAKDLWACHKAVRLLTIG